MTIGPHRILIKEIHHPKLTRANLKAAYRQFVEQRKRTPLVLDLLVGKRENLVNHHSRDIRRLNKLRVPDDIKVRESRDSQTLAQPRAASLFDIRQRFGGV